jgi:hypothetical protein
MRNAEWNGRREGLCAGFRRGEGREEGDGGLKRNGGWKGNGGRGRGTGRERGTGRDGRGSENESDLFRCPPALFRRHLLRGALNLRHFNYSLIFESNLCRRFKRGFIRKRRVVARE